MIEGNWIRTPADLRSIYGYMFNGPNIGIEMQKGWFSVFAQLCIDIDNILGKDKSGFHWTQTKEKFGTARYYWTINTRVERCEPDAARNRAITSLVIAAENATCKLCIVCARSALLDKHDGYVLTLCNQHARARRLGHELDIWFAQ